MDVLWPTVVVFLNFELVANLKDSELSPKFLEFFTFLEKPTHIAT